MSKKHKHRLGKHQQLGKLKQRYLFVLNPYSDVRASQCPQCGRPTQPHQFPLFIHVDGWGPFVLGKTCPYCPHCELIIAHQKELESQLAYNFLRLAPEVIGNDYTVLGTLDQKVYKEKLSAGVASLDSSLEYIAEFKHVLDLEVPGGEGPA
jgi:hypothetical protein